VARILIIDDEPDVRNLVKLMLSGKGYEILAIDSRELVRIERQRFDLIITDMMMPDVDGVSVIRRLVQVNDNISIIAMSGAGSQDEYGPLDVAVRWGARHVIAKPFHRSDLLALVDGCLKTKEQTRRS
jgi:two-component system, OmpR family, phosphate regulon response regulator OmpR